MFKLKIVVGLVFVLFTVSCVNNAKNSGLEGDTIVPDYSDPDPINLYNDNTIPAAPSDLDIVVNIDGEIRLFNADDPAGYTLLAADASVDPYFEDIILSEDKEYLLYVNTEKELVLFDVSTKGIKIVLQEDVTCNETQFIDSDSIQFSHSSNIYCYTISADSSYLMIDDPVLYCNHGAVVSPDGTKIVFKNQDPTQHEYAVYAWAEVTGATVATCNYLGDYTGDINLFELFEFIWINNETIFMKPNAELNNRIKAYNLTKSIPVSANLTDEGSVIGFTEITLSADRTKLCAFGSFGLYQVEVSTVDFESSIVVDRIYESELVTTKFAAYSADSAYLVAATRGCIGVYESGTLKQTDFDSTGIISEGETLYALDCK